ncbi:MAG: ABC transporter ATP-binding protein, partial [Pseudonocardiaceae bacterium]
MSGPGGRMMMGPPTTRSLDFKNSGKRLLAQLTKDRAPLWGMVLAVIGSVACSVVGPKILGKATDLVFAGLVGRNMPRGITKEQALEGLRAKGEGGMADMLSGTDFTPGQGIDFDAVGVVALWALATFTAAGLLMLVATRLANRVMNGTLYRMREELQGKLSRLPLAYFDQQKRGEVLSRATNDMDNIQQTLQQSMGQLVNSLLTIVGVLAMMFWVSPLLALVALVTVPLSFVVATRIGKRSQPHFVQQWRTTGKLNAHIEETYSGFTIVKTFGHRAHAQEQFRELNDDVYHTSFGAQFFSGLVSPATVFIGNLSYVAVAVVGGIQVATGQITLGSIQAFIQYVRQFNQPLTQVAAMYNTMQSGV